MKEVQTGFIPCQNMIIYVNQRKSIYEDYKGAGKYGNLFSINVGPNYEGKIRKIDVETLQKVGQMIKITSKNESHKHCIPTISDSIQYYRDRVKMCGWLIHWKLFILTRMN